MDTKLRSFSVALTCNEDGCLIKECSVGFNVSITDKVMESSNCILICGRVVYDELFMDSDHRRTDIIISRSQSVEENLRDRGNTHAFVATSMRRALQKASQLEGEILIVGGVSIINLALTKYLYLCHKIYMRKLPISDSVPASIPLDILGKYNGTCEIIPNVEHPEEQYKRLIEKILENNPREDRTGVGTRSTFAEHMSFDISNTVPVLTTKRTAWKTIIKEMLFFISGETDTKLLEDRGVFIWKDNTSKEFLKAKGLSYRAGCMGPGYGFQWRHWGAKYEGPDKDYTGQGTDQLSILINNIKTNPNSRRHILTSWNVSDLPNMALPPCHYNSQFYVSTDGTGLSCILTQRSADVFLGLPFNIAMYSFLTYVIAKLTNLKPDKLHINLGDCHVYLNHTEQARKLLHRTPLPFPTLELEDFKDIDSLTLEHFKLKSYMCWPRIKADMAI